MLRSDHDFPHSGDVPGLTPSEREEGWQNIQAFMEEERAAASLFEGVEAVQLTAEEKSASWNAIQAHVTREQEVAAFLHEGQAVALSAEEKSEVWTALAPMSQSAARDVTLPWYERAVDACNTFFRFGWAVPALGILLITTTVGASYASADSLPGEFLYSVKKVGEQLRSGLHLTTESRAEGEAKRMSNRVHEVELLKKREQLTDDVRASLDQEYKLERRKAIQHITELEAEGNQEVSSRLRARLNALEDQYESLVNGDSREEPENRRRRDFPTVVEDKVEEVLENVQSATESSVSVSGSVRSSKKKGSDDSSDDESSAEHNVKVKVQQDVNITTTNEVSSDEESSTADDLNDIGEQVDDILEKALDGNTDL